jgi:hypothetical protein
MKTLLRSGCFPFFACALWLALATATVAAAAPAPQDSLAQAFATPPAAARPWVYWMWMDGNLNREGLTADLEAMKRAGIGGVIIMEVNVGIPQGPVKFMSPEWRQLFKHVISEAERLGLQVTLNAGPGWTGSGGPWVKPEQSMQHLVASSYEVTGPTNFAGTLPRPQRRRPFFGDGALPAELERAKNEFYRDVAVLAFPTPTGEPPIRDIDEKALYVRAPYSSQPGVKAFLPAPASYPILPAGAAIDPTNIVDLSDKLTPDGRLDWNVPPGRWTVLRFGRTTTGANTRPAPIPGLGLESDKMDRAALDAHFEQFIGTLLRDLGPRTNSADAGWKYLHIDSWEMSSQNWTLAFRDEFRRRRGYDPLRYLPTLTGRAVDSLEISERFLWDLRQTAQELMIENHAEHLKELGRQHGFGLSIEPYDMMPCADMSFGAVADVPMCEFWLYGFNTSFSVLEAASIAHTCGRPIVAAESFTSSDQEHWQAHPASMKALGDWAFCAGVNRIVFHRYQHQPWLDKVPGMTMGPYGVHWERTQTWWDMAQAYHEYLSRCQFLLRQGLSVADVCFLVAEGSPHVFRPPHSATEGNPPARLGYNFDGCAPETLLSRMTVKNGRLVLPDGMSYRVLVLPQQETMTPRLLRKIKELVAAGATVIGPPPLKSPSLSGYPQCDTEVKQLTSELWHAPSTVSATGGMFISPGHVVWSQAFETAVAESAHPLQNARWIWFPEGNPAAQAPVGKRYFRRLFVLETNQALVSASISLTADNSFQLQVNGRTAAHGDNFNQVVTTDITALLRPGTNLLAVAAQNGGDAPNPAGLLGSLKLRFRNGQTLELPTDHRWQAADTSGPDWATALVTAAAWREALELGAFDMAPWHLPTKLVQEPEQYCDFAVVTNLLHQLNVPPDFESLPASDISNLKSEISNLRYIHRHDGDTDLYFVANPENHPVDAVCLFRISRKQPELWDPVTGQTRPLWQFRFQRGRTSVPLHFEPTQSFFIVFRNPPAEHRGTANFRTLRPMADLSGPWEVAFDPKRGGPAQITFSQLDDWSLRAEPGIKYYSGTATYKQTFELPSGLTNHATRITLSLGSVHALARVRLNGRELGVVWGPPWQVDITAAVQPRDNRLEVEVANLWPNRLIGDEQFPADCDYGRGGNLSRWPEWLLQNQARPSQERLTFTTWKHFSKNDPLLPSGLLGPVQILRDRPSFTGSAGILAGGWQTPKPPARMPVLPVFSTLDFRLWPFDYILGA